MKFEEDLIINQEIDNSLENEDDEIEVVDEYYYEQLLNDLAIDIKIEMQDYCRDMSLMMCEHLTIDNLLKLIKNE